MICKQRRGFSLVELLVVIGILLLLAGMAFAIFNSSKSSDRMRSGARAAQSAFLGAKDRALHAKDFRGVRLTRDPVNLNLINGFVYLQPLPMQSAGFINGINPQDFSIDRPGIGNTPPNSDATRIVVATQLLVNGNWTPTEWQSLLAQDANSIWPSTALQIRIPSSQGAGGGKWYQLQRQSNSAPYWWVQDPNNVNQAFLYLQTSYPGGSAGNPTIAATDTTASCDIQLGNDVLPFHQPISLPSGCVIDLAYCNANVQILAGYVPAPQALPYIRPLAVLPNPIQNADIMFSPRGNVTGSTAALGALFFCLRGVQDATLGLDPAYDKRDPNYPQVPGDTLILGVFPQTGLVQTFDADLTDVVINATGLPGTDGAADNLFNFAQRGMAAGR